MSADGLELSMSRRTSANAQESLDAKFEGTELTVAFNPQFLHDGIDAVDTDEVVLETDRPAEAGDAARRRQRRLPVPADAGAHVLSAMLAAVGDRSVARRRSPLARPISGASRSIDLELASGLTVDARRERAGQDEPARSDRRGLHAAQSFRGVTDAPLVRDGSRAGDRARRDRRRRARAQLFEAEIRASGRNRVQCNTQPLTRHADLHGLLRVTVFAPDDLELVKGGPVGAARLSRRAARRCSRRATTRRAPTSNGC